MSAVFIKCPETRDVIPTGVDVRTLDELEPVYLLAQCGSCGREHEWFADEATLEVSEATAPA